MSERVTYAKALAANELADRMMRDHGLTWSQVLLLRNAAVEKDPTGSPRNFPGELVVVCEQPVDLASLRENGWVRREYRCSSSQRGSTRVMIRVLLEEAKQKLAVALGTKDEQKYRTAWFEAHKALNEADRLHRTNMITTLTITDKGRNFVKEFESLLIQVGDFTDSRSISEERCGTQ